MVVRNKRGFFPEGSLPLVSGFITLQLKRWKIRGARRESCLSSWESWGLTHGFSVCSVGVRRCGVCSGQGSGEDDP